METLGPFRLVEPLGTGGMGEVWRAEHGPSGVSAALKVLKAARERSPHLALFEQEIEAVARLDHPSIAMILDHGRVPGGHPRLTEGNPWFAMEHCRGDTLDKRRGRLLWSEVRRYLLTLLDALAHAHAQGIVHRDLKPSNVMLGGERASLVLVDFGLAHVQGGSHDARMMSAGTPAYMAPEQFAGDWRQFGPWTDLYAMGCVAWALLFGKSPFVRSTIAGIANAHIHDPVPDLPAFGSDDVPAEAHRWMARLMAKDPAARFATAADAARALAAVPAGPARTDHPHDTPRGDPSESLSLTVLGEALRPLPRGGRPAGDPQVPADWRAPDPAWPPHDLVAAGLGLLGVRRVPFVGRVAERDRLWQALRDAGAEGSARVVWVTGPPGIGRSRLARWLAERADELGAATTLVVTHTDPPATTDGLGVALSLHLRVHGLPRGEVVEALEGWTGTEDPWAARVLAEALQPTRAAEPEVRLEAPGERQRVWWSALRRLAGRGPVVVVLDDVQWGAGSLQSLRAALGDDPYPVVWVATHPGTADDARAVAGDLLDDPRCTLVELGPLDGSDAVALARAILPLTAADAGRVAQRTGGHPLLSVRLLGSWVDRGLVHAGARGFSLDEHLPVPATLAALWDARLDDVCSGWSEARRRALGLAAVMGVEVDTSAWRAQCATLDPPADPGALAPALVGGLMRRSAPGRVRFTPPALRERLEARIPPPTRAAWHRRCAEALDGTDADERRAHHLRWGGLATEALDLLLDAGRRSLLRDAYDEAAARIDHARRTARALHLEPHDRRMAQLTILEVTHDIALRHGRADTAPLQAVLDQDDLPATLRGDAAQLIGLIKLMSGQPGPSEQALRRALELHADAPAKVAESCRRLADLATWTGRHDASAALLDRAHALAPETNPRGRASVLYSRARLAMFSGDPEGARVLLQRSRRAYADLGSRRGMAECVNELGELARREGDLELARRWYTEARELYLSLGTTTGMVLAQANLALVEHASGNFEQAAEGLEAALARAQRSAGPGLQAGLAASLAASLLCLKRAIPAARYLSESIARIEEHAVVSDDVAQALWSAAEAAHADYPDLAAAAAGAARAQWEALGDAAGVARVDASGWRDPEDG